MTVAEPSPCATLLENSTPVLETRRLVLRAPCIEDVPAIAELANNRKIAEMTATLPFPYTVEDARFFVEQAAFTPVSAIFTLLLKQGGTQTFVGMCGYTPRTCEADPVIGYWLGEPFWGQGLATESMQAVIDHAFSATSLQALAGNTRVVNGAARRVLEKCGFQWQGVGLWQVKVLGASLPVDRLRLERAQWANPGDGKVIPLIRQPLRAH